MNRDFYTKLDTLTSPMNSLKRTFISLILFLTTFSVYAESFSAIVSKAKGQGFSGVISYQIPNNRKHFFTSSANDFKSDTRFAIGSISKLFTALAIFQLKEQGRLDLDVPVSSYFRHQQLPDAWSSWLNKVSINDLLQHRSGLPGLLYPSEDIKAIYNHVNETSDLSGHFFKAENATFDEALLANNLNNSEDGVYYSNVAYNLLALIVENVSGVSFDEYLRIHIFQPAGMRDTFSGSKDSASFFKLIQNKKNIAKPLVYGIDFNSRKECSAYCTSLLLNNKYSSQDFNFAFTYGAGSIISSENDLSRWLAMLLNSKKLLKNPQPFFALNTEDEIWGHQGELPGYRSILSVNLVTQETIIVLSNQNYDIAHYYDVVISDKGKTIKNFISRGQQDGIENELIKAYNKQPFLNPVNIAIALTTT